MEQDQVEGTLEALARGIADELAQLPAIAESRAEKIEDLRRAAAELQLGMAHLQGNRYQLEVAGRSRAIAEMRAAVDKLQRRREKGSGK